jgi:glutathione S-transferase
VWAAEEVSADFAHIPTAYTDPVLKEPEYLAINPNGAIPAIVEDGFSLWESMAISFYLARRAESPLLPTEPRQEALVLQWTFWVMTEVEKPILAVIFHRLLYPEAERNAAEAEKGEETVLKRMRVLDDALEGREYLVGSRFTLADLNVAAVLSFNEHARIDFSPFPRVTGWLDRCLSRPSVERARRRA